MDACARVGEADGMYNACGCLIRDLERFFQRPSSTDLSPLLHRVYRLSDYFFFFSFSISPLVLAKYLKAFIRLVHEDVASYRSATSLKKTPYDRENDAQAWSSPPELDVLSMDVGTGREIEFSPMSRDRTNVTRSSTG